MPIKYVLNFGWSGKSDPEWQFRKLLDKKERDEFDAKSDDEKRDIVEEWQLEQVGMKFK